MRKWTMWLAAGLLLAGTPLTARQAVGARGPQVGRMAPAGVERNIEIALQRAEALELDEARIAQLKEMQEELAQMRTGFADEVQEYRTRMLEQERATREARRAEMRELAERRRASLLPYQERFEELLTVEERSELRTLAAQRVGRGAGAGIGGRSAMRAGARGGIAPRAGVQRRPLAGTSPRARSRVPRASLRRMGPAAGIVDRRGAVRPRIRRIRDA